jgi:hypothetical protein
MKLIDTRRNYVRESVFLTDINWQAAVDPVIDNLRAPLQKVSDQYNDFELYLYKECYLFNEARGTNYLPVSK